MLELPDPYPGLPQLAPGIERAEEEWRKRLAALAACAPDGASVETEVLVALCEERRPVLAVVGSRGLHGFQGLLLGSTERHLVNNAPCPVLIVRTAPNEEAP